MKKTWMIPAAFFAACCVLNLAGCLTDGGLERIFKPALMPMLCATTLTWLLCKASQGVRIQAKPAALLITGQLFGFAGDVALMGKGFSFFALGVALFLTGHIFYISVFGGRSLKGIRPWQWLTGIAVALAATAGFAVALGINGVMLAPMGIYGFTLMMLIFSTFTGALRFGGLTWWLLTAGAVLFTFSDALIAVRNFGSLSPFMNGFGVMSTYLAAQSLLAAGGLRLVTGAGRHEK